MSINYTGIFFKDGSHMTWKYGTPLQYPPGVKPGDKAKVTVRGHYEDSEVGCLVVSWEGHNEQPGAAPKLLHITTKCVDGAKPVLSGVRATKKGFQPCGEYELEGEWK